QSEQRAVLQMVFDTKEKADAAYEKLNEGEDFIAVAEENGQKADEINLGFVSANDVSEELSNVIFATDAGKYSEPVQIADSWQILKVNDIKKAMTTPINEIYAKIADELRQNKEYDNNYTVISEIDDKVGAGETLQEIAASYSVPLLKIKGLSEDGKAEALDDNLKNVVTDKEFLEVAFSYNENEIGQTVETNDGIAVVLVDKINESHKKSREQAEDELIKVWEENERAAITQETIDNIEHDLDAGDDLATVASRYNLQVVNSRPATRNETIDKISFVEMKKLFSAPKNEPQIIKLGDDYIVAETTNIYDDSDSINSEKREELKNTLYKESVAEMEEALLQDFARNYKIIVNYNRIGTED
ncbi:MAG: peptidyl-prolyl cis-trans isomerase, partial [Alphaproteobacteria bacterium]|nr:peptidyl-prolyl cis-trans isomerase [Alphaproteobacteria bacterium]